MTEQTLEKMNRMHMKGMSQTYAADMKLGQLGQYTIDEYLSRLIDDEWLTRQDRKIANLKKLASFRAQAHPLNIDYTLHRQLDKNQMERFLGLEFIKLKENIIFTGPTGTGKSYLAQCIGVRACEMLKKVIYYSMNALSDTIQAMHIQGNYHKWILKIKQVELLIIDDFGLTMIEERTRKALMEIIDFRYDKHPIIFISQIPVSEWHSLIGEDTIADAIMDRIVHNSYRMELKGESVRRNKKVRQY
jgi:DNA replication protein DnaC